MKTNSDSRDPLRGFTGKIGDSGMYRRVVNGKVIIQTCPRKKKNKNKNAGDHWSDQNKRFHQAIQWASIIVRNDEIKALYAGVARGSNSANTMAIKDYLRPAVIGAVLTTGYQGRAGYGILIRVENIVPVKTVTVTIESVTGERIESGPATRQLSGSEWKYITTCANPSYRGSLLRISACDLPGHTVEWTRVL
ncbi:MAG: hypothetical protein M0Q38_07865 [Bacteroidales bacterium]|jgi:hypothetical protein|nr:hypothetical protein [Bacteroidales bacterium]